MALRDDILERATSPIYRLWTKVNAGFKVATNAQSNQLWQRIQGEPVVDHYTIELGPGGAGPGTHFGSAGNLEQREALDAADWYDGQTSSNIEAWLLLPSGELIWSKTSGVQVGSAFFSDYVSDFLPTLTPSNLLPIT